MEDRLTAYKFLAAGSVGPFSGFRWTPGEWVEATGPLDPCRSGIHACRAADLPYWIGEELWRVELAGETRELAGVVVAERGRLVEHVARWTLDAALQFAADAAEQAVECGRASPRAAEYGADAETFARRAARFVDAAELGFVAAEAAEAASAGGRARERARQAEALTSLLGL